MVLLRLVMVAFLPFEGYIWAAYESTTIFQANPELLVNARACGSLGHATAPLRTKQEHGV
jgi:hypothetical protein